MMVHYQGDIVNSFYDTFLISWSIPFEPDLVCLQEETPANQDFHFGMDNSTLVSIKEPLQRAVARARLQLQRNQNTENKFSTPTINRKVTHLTFHDAARKALVEIRNTCSFDKSTIQSLTIDFTPFIFHTRHQPIPIALVNRSPNGTPGHIDKINPQDIAWLYAFRYAQKSLFIQSPNFNATPAVDGIISACRRGIKVILWLDLGYNYLKEGFGTFQGGTNEHIVKKIYKELKSHDNGAEKNLQIFWYTAKDQTRPCHFSEKKRNCHIKFMSIDDQVAIVGSGNMDTQTWFHSQEMNTMIDSPVIVKEWMNALYTNQSTNEYGRLNDNGEWHGISSNLNS
ncbi:hypothetical protein I4U23_005986 [Adineta vaga]|nr:hypothetical protein I4U23_005986 [Adineta vaga]